MHITCASVRNDYKIFLFFLHNRPELAAFTPLTLLISLRGFAGFTSDACTSAHAGTIVAEASLDKNVERRRRLVSWVRLGD